MTTKRAQDFLDKELFVNNNIVTFRSLSRELGIHVNDAKNELQCYHDSARDTNARAVPTYLVSGEVPVLTVNAHAETQQSECAMDLDPEFEEREEIDVVYQNKVLLVDAPMLNEAKPQFSRIHSVHIYCLSPSRFWDAGLVCAPNFKIHETDAKGGPGFFSMVGKITGSHVKLRGGVTYKNATSSSKATLDAPAKVTPKPVASVKTEEQAMKGKTRFSDEKEQAPMTPLARTESKDRPKTSGKLDWSKAKTKGKEPVVEKAEEDKTFKIVPKSNVAISDSSTSKNSRSEPKKLAPSKLTSSSVVSSDLQERGVKRKPRTDTDQESESEPSSVSIKPTNASGPSLRKGVVYSDEDEDSESQVRMLGRRHPQKKSTMTSDSEMSLQAMMDVDDDQVDRVSRISITRRREEEESTEPEKEVSMPPVTSEGEGEESDDVPIVPKKRKPRRVIPVGRNGLRKRRVVKSRTTTDTKGYMQTEDYSSYESVEEGEEVQTTSKGKRRVTKQVLEPKIEAPRGAMIIVKEESIREPRAKPAPKPRGASKRGGLLNFFGSERGKK